MAVEVKIELEGLALCFLKEPHGSREKVWNVAFLCDDDHVLELVGLTPPKNPWRPLGTDIIVDIGPSVELECTKGNFTKLLNISHPDYGHGERSTDLSKLDIKRRRVNTTLVWLRVPHSKMKVEKSENTKIMRTRPNPGVPTKVNGRGKLVKLTFEIEGASALILKDYLTGVELPGYSPIPIPGTKNITLRFNNKCAGCARNDFIDLYEFVVHEEGEGANKKEYQYSSWAEDAEPEAVMLSDERGEREEQERRLDAIKREGNCDVTAIRDGFLIKKKLAKHSITTSYGNCDPVASDPPPGP